MIMLCLALFRIDDLGPTQFSRFANCQEPTKMANFLNYIFDTSPTSPVQCTVKQEWCKCYDVTYVEESLIGKIEELTPFMTDLASSLLSKADGLVAAKEEKKAAAGITQLAKKKLTVLAPPNITKPRPRRVPEPMKITNSVHVGAEPTYLDRTSLAEIEDEKKRNLEEVRLEFWAGGRGGEGRGTKDEGRGTTGDRSQ